MNAIDLRSIVEPADALIVVPPFAGLDRPSLGAHLLQACARVRGFRVEVLYANLQFAAEIGEIRYQAVCFAPTSFLLGERVFAATAYGVPPLGRGEFTEETTELGRPEDDPALSLGLPDLREVEAAAASWIDRLTEAILRLEVPVIGCTTMFEQTAASVALLKRLKRARSETVTIIGGPNCEGEMAEGIRTLSDGIDHVFSGECERAFPDFLAALRAGERPGSWLVRGSPCLDLDALPITDFTGFYRQLAHFLPESVVAESGELWLPYESSRGCWWGEKSHCTFCGINGETMAFRAKSPDKVISELRVLSAQHPTPKVCMVDNIMPHTYFKTLLPRLGDEVPGLELFYEQKANLTLEKVEALRRAGVSLIQPGIEALATPLLQLMAKGVQARQNLALLRYCRAVGLGVNWNLLYAFPADSAEDYEDTLSLMPLVHHLMPPDGPCHLSIDRFSPYFRSPERFGISAMLPMPSYAAILPERADVAKVAYHFMGDYSSGSAHDPRLVTALDGAIKAWRGRWNGDGVPPALTVAPIAEDTFLLIDTRGLTGCQTYRFLDRTETAVALAGAPLECREEVRWALEQRLLVELDGRFVPLATAPPALLRACEAPTAR
ncbi:MAG TPA: RiPP maturation radical SAM C-methyltransferase, partial [Thermoanaerobaculia bacterium]|nr:RiPP maturation radical SAM C-methyltransferase [Thermoanaerobaculia bacterium]